MSKLVVVALVVALAAGCDVPGSPPPTSSVKPADTSSTSSPAEPEITLRGTVQPGVEPGCLVLDSGGELYLLLGGAPEVVRVGAVVVVRGHPRPGLMTTCQQGTPFSVSDAQPA